MITDRMITSVMEITHLIFYRSRHHANEFDERLNASLLLLDRFRLSPATEPQAD
jgi:hypothetical protein